MIYRSSVPLDCRLDRNTAWCLIVLTEMVGVMRSTIIVL